MSVHLQQDKTRQAFSLIELLTVIAVIAILATLLMTAIGSSKERARQMLCTSNLRQISLAMNMYLDDLEKRPPGLDSLVGARYIANKEVFICPDDRTKDWGRLVNQLPSFTSTSYTVDVGDSTDSPSSPPAQTLPYSYLHPLQWNKEAWNRLMQAGSSAGFATCELHGLGKPNLAAPSMYDFQGLILRAQRDGAVVRRQNYWAKGLEEARTTDGPAAPSSGLSSGPSLDYPWTLFTDVVPVE
jgi:prepilin-type N-terminal cleavage/methylation domain-containing protein